MFAAWQKPASAMQQPAAKHQPLAAMQQPATKKHPQAVMQQSATMQPISFDESPIFKRNSSAESPNLEDTANNDNGHIDFNVNSSMPSIINLATTGLRRSPRIAAKEPEKIHSSLSCNAVMKSFCVFGVAMTSMWTLGESSLYCHTQKPQAFMQQRHQVKSIQCAVKILIIRVKCIY